MTLHFGDDTLTVHVGDARTVLEGMEAASVQCVVTSPPYWGLRDYGTATWEGGDPECDHRLFAYPPGTPTPGGRGGTMPRQEQVQRDSCRKCGAIRIDSQIGLESTPEAYVEALVGVFRAVRRVLRDDGTLWLNLGDSYAGARSEGGGTMAGFNDRYFGRETDGGKQTVSDTSKPSRAAVAGLKPKDLVGIPWRVAFALQADGWYLRSDIIWAKPNPMPESVTDRPTKSHEYLFLLSKSARYWYDADAVAEESTGRTDVGKMSFRAEIGAGGVWRDEARSGDVSRRNLRSVWTVATEPYPGAHFATFPRKLIEPAIKAGCPEGGVVLDPFAGSGTTGFVAQALGRRAVLIELNPAYIDQAMVRNAQMPLGVGASVEPQT